MSLVNTDTGEITSESLEELEEIIGQGLETFIAVGDALAKVRDSKLYLEHAETFEAYCSERWNLSRSRAYQLIDAAAVSTIVDTAPANEGQARELLPLRDDPSAAQAAMASAVESAEAEGRKVTAADIKAAVTDQIGPQEKAQTPPSAPPVDLEQDEDPAPRPVPTPPSPRLPKSAHIVAVEAVISADRALEKFLAVDLDALQSFDEFEWEVVQFLTRRASEVSGRIAEAGRRRRRFTALNGGKK